MKLKYKTMKIRNFIHTTVIAAAVLFVASCANEDILDSSSQSLTGQEVAINFSYTVQGLSPGDGTGTLDPQTRTVPADLEAIDGTSLPIENMFIIQFNGNASSSKMIGAPRFLNKTDLSVGTLSVPLIQQSGLCYTLFVANIPEGNNYNWNMSTESTFADVVKRIRTIANENATYVTVGEVKTLVASAVVENVVVPGTPLTPSFTRSVAKLTLNLKLSNADMEIKSVRLRNVATSIVYADAALEKSGVTGTTVYPADITTIDYDVITATADMPTNDETKPFSWYVPRNQRGVNTSSTGAVNKTFYAPDNATFFEIVAVKTDGSATSIFRVYPGANEIDDYNITANNHYTINLEVKGIGDSSMDSRVETFENVSYVDNGGWGSKSNSFIINPAPTGGGFIYYDIPIDQVNRYWNGTVDGYGNTSANVIGANDIWNVSLIWSDDANLFGNNTENTKIHLLDPHNEGFGQGRGPAQYFRLYVPAGVPEGNFTLGIKRDGGSDYLWSWHFWVTSYNPGKFNKTSITPGVYTYYVPGGQVERYVDNGSTTLWGTGKTYEKSVMMDRPLGMVSENHKKQPTNTLRGILHYQFGRKDPFPNSAALTGTSIAIESGPVANIKASVAIPNKFITGVAGSSYAWTMEAGNTSYTWCDPNAGTAGGKSIYDPCPPGWRMPVNGTWSDFNRQIEGSYINTINPLRDLGYNYGRGFGSASAPVNGLRYWPGTTADAPVGGTIWIPAAGYRGADNGSLGLVGSYGYYWSATPNGANGCLLYFNSTYVGPSGNTSRAYGFSVRCVQA
jgi:uncharacterized protein (TIGR02145 family)